MYVYCIEMYILYIQYIYTLQVHISTTDIADIVIHYVRQGCQFPNTQEIQF